MITLALAMCVWHGSQTLLPCYYFTGHRTMTCQIFHARKGNVLGCVPLRKGSTVT